MKNGPKLKVIHGQAYATSLDISAHFQKSHDNVLKAIRNKMLDCSAAFSAVNFDGSTYIGRNGKPHPIFNVTRDGFAMIAMSFTGTEATIWQEAYITAFNQMEAELQRRNLKDGRIEQMNLFPGLRVDIDETRPTISVSNMITVKLQFDLS
ncbi:MAG: Rha family transcriptional regulator [Acidobacteria bacterium]|nr:Rha family transcriptional regulator [Acidobacteriota bacterium]